MQDGKSSQTAQYITFCRALETGKPPARRLFNDPFAFALLSGSYKMLARMSHVPILRKLIYAGLDLGVPRTRGVPLSCELGQLMIWSVMRSEVGHVNWCYSERASIVEVVVWMKQGRSQYLRWTTPATQRV